MAQCFLSEILFGVLQLDRGTCLFFTRDKLLTECDFLGVLFKEHPHEIVHTVPINVLSIFHCTK